jgi:glutathione S-transferase
MAEYKLHCFTESGNAYKVALMLQLTGTPWELRFVDFFKGEARSPEFLKLNEMGEVPVLEHAGRSRTQSGVILTYLSRELGRFGAADEEEQLRWLFFDNHKFTS